MDTPNWYSSWVHICAASRQQHFSLIEFFPFSKVLSDISWLDFSLFLWTVLIEILWCLDWKLRFHTNETCFNWNWNAKILNFDKGHSYQEFEMGVHQGSSIFRDETLKRDWRTPQVLTDAKVEILTKISMRLQLKNDKYS